MTRSNDDYVYTGLANLDRDYAVNGLNQYTAVGVSPLTYDSNGNLVADGANTYGYDAENRLISTSFGVSMGYDPLGRLFQLGTPGGTRQMLYDGDQLVGEYDQASGATLGAYVHGPAEDDPLAWYDSAGFVRLLHADHQGSIIGMAGGPEGRLAATNAYDEYGTPRSGNTGRFQYTGQAWLAELGMYYYKARIYSPKLGRFLQTDPIGTTDQINLYAYVGNDPVDGRDPTGLAGEPGIGHNSESFGEKLSDVAETIKTGVLIGRGSGVGLILAALKPSTLADGTLKAAQIKSLEKSISSFERLAQDHEKRAAEQAAHPTTRPGMEKQSAEKITAQNDARVNKLKRDAADFRKQAERAQEKIDRLKKNE